MPYILENATRLFQQVRKVFRRKIGIRNSTIFQKEQGQPF